MTPDASFSRRAPAAVLLAFAVSCVYFTGVFPPWSNPNELSRWETVVSMAESRTFSIDDAIERLGDHEDKAIWDGRFYSNKAPGLAFAAYPVYRVLRLVMPTPSRGTSDALFALTRLFTVSLLCVIALRRFSVRIAAQGSATAAAVTVFAVGLGTPFLLYARTFFSHAWTAALLFLAWDGLKAAERPGGRADTALSALSGFLAAWAVISEYTVASIALALGLRAAAGRSPRRLVAFGLGAALPLGLLAGYDAACFGSPWALSSSREADPQYAALARQGFFGFQKPSAAVAVRYLADPARGLLLFSPFWLWGAAGLARWWRLRRDRADWWFLVAGIGLFFVCLCGYPNWHGGWSLGSRYLLPAVLLAGLPLAHALESAASRGFFFAAAVFAAVAHFLLGASFPQFPIEMPWPAITGSLWFLARGWAAPSLGTLAGLGPALSLAMPAALTAWALVATARGANAARPSAPVAALLGLLPLLALSWRSPEPPYFGRLWRAGVFGAYSGRDPARQELSAVVFEANTPQEKRQAAGVWRWLGPTAR